MNLFLNVVGNINHYWVLYWLLFHQKVGKGKGLPTAATSRKMRHPELFKAKFQMFNESTNRQSWGGTFITAQNPLIGLFLLKRESNDINNYSSVNYIHQIGKNQNCHSSNCIKNFSNNIRRHAHDAFHNIYADAMLCNIVGFQELTHPPPFF